jgi:phosphatidylglycerophosphate synthase
MEDKNVNVFPPTKMHSFAARAVTPPVDILAKHYVEPNFLTVTAVIFAVCAGVCLGFGLWLWAAIFILLNGLLNITDGELSRRLNIYRTKHLRDLGVFLDPPGDRISGVAFFAGLFFYAISKYQSEFLLIIYLAFATYLTSFWIRAKIESLGLGFHFKKSFTRATLQLALMFICFGMIFAGADYQRNFFLYTVIFFIYLPKIGTFFAWSARAIVKITTGKHIGIFS